MICKTTYNILLCSARIRGTLYLCVCAAAITSHTSNSQGLPFNPDLAGHSCLCIPTNHCLLLSLAFEYTHHTFTYYHTVKIDFSTKLVDCAAVLTWGNSGLPHQNFSSTAKTLPSLTAVRASSVCAGTQTGTVAHQSQKYVLPAQQPSAREIPPIKKH